MKVSGCGECLDQNGGEMNLQYTVESEMMSDVKERCRWDHDCEGFMFSAASKSDSIIYHNDKIVNDQNEIVDQSIVFSKTLECTPPCDDWNLMCNRLIGNNQFTKK